MKVTHPTPTPTSEFDPDPVFIFGMRPRTGTHFLANLLCQHPDCVTSAIAEDSLLVDAHLLSKYVSKTSGHWAFVAGKKHPGYDDLLYECIGTGLISFLYKIRHQADEDRAKKFGVTPSNNSAAKTLITKTPSANNLGNFFRFFPRARLLILVRDGRAVVESAIKSFGSEAEKEIRAWADATSRVLEFSVQAAGDAKKKYMIVRFEDLHTQTETEMRKILSFLELDVEKYDFRTALNLPVVGSSTFKRPPGKVQWMPVMKTAEFDPLARANQWTRVQHERFNWIAGNQLEQLGYIRKVYTGQRFRWRIWNRVMDLLWSTKAIRKK
jgi:hypothetical protein